MISEYPYSTANLGDEVYKYLEASKMDGKLISAGNDRPFTNCHGGQDVVHVSQTPDSLVARALKRPQYSYRPMDISTRSTM